MIFSIPFARRCLPVGGWLLALLAVPAFSAPAIHPLTFTRAFAPAEGQVSPPEQPYRQELCLNGLWRFQPVALPGGFKHDQGASPTLAPPTPGVWARTRLKVPSPWNVNAFNRDDGGDFRCYPHLPEGLGYGGDGLAGAVVPRPGSLEGPPPAPALRGRGRRRRRLCQRPGGRRTTSICSCPSSAMSPMPSSSAASTWCGWASAKPRCSTTPGRPAAAPIPAARSGGRPSRASGRTFLWSPCRRAHAEDTYVKPEVSRRHADRRSDAAERHGAAADGSGRRVGAALDQLKPA